jgi:aminoglycoside 6'-N-acetyltransferase I
MRIIDLSPEDERSLHQAAALLVEGFRVHWPSAWPDMDAALAEVREALEPGKICRVALDGAGLVLGWIGGIPSYGGNVWELHPLVVRPDHQRRGIGRTLVADLEAQVRERGGLTLWLGSDDEDDMTSLSGVDLYDDLPGQLARIRNLKGHPYEFYLKCGFIVAGVVPDANGPGKPDILMAKQVRET